MDKEQIERLIHMNQRQSLLIGYATSLMYEMRKELDESRGEDIENEKYKWFRQAIENLFYLNKPFPPMP